MTDETRDAEMYQEDDGQEATGTALVPVDGDDGAGWEHVSVSIPDSHRTPTWSEMCEIKAMFWDAEDCVVQFHPPAKDDINTHKHCLHMWRRAGEKFPTPPNWMV